NKDTRIGRKTADIFRQVDEALGSFVSRARPDDLILFISDHGFQSCTRTVNMDRLLKEFGYLDFSASSHVFGPMQWGPMRKVARKTGKTPVKEIYKREEIFKGRFADTAPDILMVPSEGYSLTHAKTALEDADWVSGDHRIEGTIVAVGPDVKPFEAPPALIDM